MTYWYKGMKFLLKFKLGKYHYAKKLFLFCRLDKNKRRLGCDIAK